MPIDWQKILPQDNASPASQPNASGGGRIDWNTVVNNKGYTGPKIETPKQKSFWSFLPGAIWENTGERAIRTSGVISTLASMPIAYGIEKLAGGDLTFKDIATETVRRAEQIKTGQSSISDYTQEAYQMYLKDRGVGKYGKNKIGVQDIGMGVALAVESLVGLEDLFLYGVAQKGVRTLADAVKWRKTGEVIKPLEEGAKFITKTKVEVPLSEDLKIRFTPGSNKVTVQGFMKRFSKSKDKFVNALEEETGRVIKSASNESDLAMKITGARKPIGKINWEDKFKQLPQETKAIVPLTAPGQQAVSTAPTGRIDWSKFRNPTRPIPVPVNSTEGRVVPITERLPNMSKYGNPSQEVAKAFERSANLEKVASHNGTAFEIGTFGKNQIAKKATQPDRFTSKELASTISNIKKVYKASDNPNSYRIDNKVWISKMPDGQMRAIYTRPNKYGNEEIINWHIVNKQKSPTYLKTLESFGSPAGTRTRMTDLEDRRPVQLADRTDLSVALPGQKVNPASINRMINPPANKVTRDEGVLLRMRLRTEAKAAKQAIRGYKTQQRELKAISDTISKEMQKPRMEQQKNISLLRGFGELNQTSINDMKTELGIERPVSEMKYPELKSLVDKTIERVEFKIKHGYKPSPETMEKYNLKSAPKRLPTEDDYFNNRGISKSKPRKIPKHTLSKMLVPISTRLENIAVDLKYAMRKFEFQSMGNVKKSLERITPYLKKTKVKSVGSGLSVSDAADLDLALKNGDSAKIKAINAKYGLTEQFDKVRDTLNDIYARANAVGFDIGYQKEYWPRMIKDPAGFLDYFGKQEYWSALAEAIKRKEMDLGRYLTTEEKANLINTMMRGYSGGQITLSKTGSMKERIIDMVTPELNRYYYDSREAIVRYIAEAEDKIAARKFFGKSSKEEGFNNIEDSIGTYVAGLLMDGKITVGQEMELRSILNARFNPKGTHGVIGIYKNLSYITVMGSPLNALTQLGDLAFSIYRGGIFRTIKNASKAMINKSAVTKEQLGIEANRIASEFEDAGKLSKAVDKLFTLTGLNRLDRLGKESLVNSSIDKFRKLATKGNKDFIQKAKTIFGDETDQFITDLINGVVSENVKYWAFNELLDFQPAALSEMPETYLTAGNGRIFYMLKSYTIKQLDVYRREAFRNIARGKTALGIKNLLYLSALLIVCGGTVDVIRNILSNKKTKLSDLAVDNLAKLAGFSRYSVNNVVTDGLGSALMEQITPATNILDDLSKDLVYVFKNWDDSVEVNKFKSIKDIPIGGKLYYYWFGKSGTESGSTGAKYSKPVMVKHKMVKHKMR